MFVTIKGLFVTWNERFNLVLHIESIKQMFGILRFNPSAIPVKRTLTPEIVDI